MRINTMPDYYVLNPLVGSDLAGHPILPAADGVHRVVEMDEIEARYFLDAGQIAVAPPQPNAPPVRGRPHFARPDDVAAYVGDGPNLLREAVELRTSAAAATPLPLDRFQILLTSSGNGRDMPAQLPDPSQVAAAVVGQRHVIRLTGLTAPGDVVPIDAQYLDIALAEFSVENEFLLVEHRATYWLAVATSLVRVSRMPWTTAPPWAS